jgi:hypothetical protein
MLHVWLIPALLLVITGVSVFYLVVRKSAGAGARSDGRVVSDQPSGFEDPPPGF